MRVLIADDEALARKRLTRLCSAIQGVEIVGECQDGEQVLERVAKGDVELVLLDIHMPNLSGLDALALLPEDGPRVVFTTAHAEHALAAFEHGAADYVLKPVEAGRLAKAIERVRVQLGARAGSNGGLDKLPIETRKGLLLLDPSELSHAIIQGELVDLHTDRGVLSTDLRLADLEKRLPHLERVHRRALVDLSRIERLESQPTGGYVAHMKDGSRVAISRASARVLRRRLGL